MTSSVIEYSTKLMVLSGFLSYLDAKIGLSDDLSKLRGLADTKLRLLRAIPAKRVSLWYVFQETARKQPSADCYVFEGVTYSWAQVERLANQYAHILTEEGVKSGDIVSLYMPNKPAFCIFWLACMAINAIPAFINTNLSGAGLVHCISVTNASCVVYDSELAPAIDHASAELSDGLRYLKYCDEFSKVGTDSSDIMPAPSSTHQPPSRLIDPTRIEATSAEPFPDSLRAEVSIQSTCCLIFTSGTTGLPKAALVSHGRALTSFNMWHRVNKFTSASRIYTPMPLYHSTAALLAVGMAWTSGSAIIIGRKFSASRYWDEVRRANANVIQYVGEVLRYLLAAPPSPRDKDHNVRLAYGNGCRPDVWTAFRERFGVTTISEFFASSEGNLSLFNYNSNALGAGAVGHDGLLARFVRRKDLVLVRIDPETEEPRRTADGLCERAAYDEPGELLGLIDPSSPFKNFTGYHGNAVASEKKILRNVLRHGDQYFRTGDLLTCNREGYYYFADRLGDTFRWKSENVSTAQVAQVLGAVVSEANVYGVLVPGYEGRAGCAAIPANPTPDLVAIAAHVRENLPKYAQPLFLRIVPKLEVTATGKYQKVALRNEGISPYTVKDPLYWLQNGEYVSFTKRDYDRISDKLVKL